MAPVVTLDIKNKLQLTFELLAAVTIPDRQVQVKWKESLAHCIRQRTRELRLIRY